MLAADDPKGEVTILWHAKEAVRGIYDHADEGLAREWIDKLIIELGDPDQAVEAGSLSKTSNDGRSTSSLGTAAT
ncbi:MAG: hypothetical protein ACRDVP_04785 [Acidimicrobiales bacterium]